MSHKIVCRENIIANIKIGNIIAFVYEDIRGKIMLSGKVVGILESESEMTYQVQTNNGSIFIVGPKMVKWVKLGSRWPIGIYNALKTGYIRK